MATHGGRRAESTGGGTQPRAYQEHRWFPAKHECRADPLRPSVAAIQRCEPEQECSLALRRQGLTTYAVGGTSGLSGYHHTVHLHFGNGECPATRVGGGSIDRRAHLHNVYDDRTRPTLRGRSTGNTRRI